MNLGVSPDRSAAAAASVRCARAAEGGHGLAKVQLMGSTASPKTYKAESGSSTASLPPESDTARCSQSGPNSPCSSKNFWTWWSTPRMRAGFPSHLIGLPSGSVICLGLAALPSPAVLMDSVLIPEVGMRGWSGRHRYKQEPRKDVNALRDDCQRLIGLLLMRGQPRRYHTAPTAPMDVSGRSTVSDGSGSGSSVDGLIPSSGDSSRGGAPGADRVPARPVRLPVAGRGRA